MMIFWTINDMFVYIVSRLDHMDKRLNGLEELKVQVTAFDKDLKKLWTLVEDKNKITENRSSAVEDKVDTCEVSQDKLYGKVVSLESEKQSLKDEIVYLQAQSMRNNLVFSNITETENETNEEAVEKLKVFVTEKMKVAKDIADKLVFERVHRMGVKRQGVNRSIVAKFHNFKERELVRKQGKALESSRLYVNKQFSKEVVDKRRRLLPKLKEARQQGKSAWLSYDTLYVDGRVVRD